MFPIVNQTIFSSDIANRIFERVQCDTFRGDVCLQSVARSLFLSKLSDGESFNLKIVSRSVRNVNKSNPVDTFKTIIDFGGDTNITDEPKSHCVRIIGLTGTPDEHVDVFEQIDCAAATVLEGYTEMQRVRRNFAVVSSGGTLEEPAVRCRAYVNIEKHNSIVIIDGIDMTRYHLLILAIHLYVPWFFEATASDAGYDVSLDDETKNLLRSCNPNNDSSEDFIAILEEMAKKYDLRTEAIKSMIGDFESRYARQMQNRISEQIENMRHEIQDLYSRIMTKNKNMMDLQMREAGYKLHADEHQSHDVMDYFLRNQDIILVDSRDSSLTFAIKGYVSMWDEDAFQRVHENKHSYLYDGAEDYDGAYLLFDHVFNTGDVRLKVCAQYTLEMFGGAHAAQNISYPAGCDGYMPNPHAHYYGCLGTHEGAIRDALMRFDYIGALDQCGAHCRNLNFNDSTVMERFSRTIFKRGAGKWFELPDGTCVNANGAIKWIKENER